jgi:hypothetical protein
VPKTVWTFELEDGKHTVELDHGLYSGRRAIRLDGRLVERTSKPRFLLFDTGSDHAFQISDHQCVILIRTDGLTFNYHLVIDDTLIKPTRLLSQLDQVYLYTTHLCVIPGICGLLVLIVLRFLSPDAPLNVLPPVLRGPALCILPALGGFGFVGFVYVVLVDISRSSLMKGLGRWILLLLSMAIYLSSVLFWAQNDQGSVGILRTLSLGVPIWSVAVPILCFASVIVLAWHPRGTYFILPHLGIALIFLTVLLLEILPPLAIAGLRPGPGAALSFVLSVVYTLLSLGMAFQERDTPLDVWHARFIYLGYYRHFLGLQQLAKQHGWEMLRPVPGTGFTFLVRGEWGGRDILIASGRQGLSFEVGSTEKLWPIYLAVVNCRSSEMPEDTARTARVADAKGKEQTLYLYPPDDEIVNDDSVVALREALELGQRFLRAQTVIWSEDAALNFSRTKIYPIREKPKDVTDILDWMVHTCQVMETNKMASPLEPESKIETSESQV